MIHYFASLSPKACALTRASLAAGDGASIVGLFKHQGILPNDYHPAFQQLVAGCSIAGELPKRGIDSVETSINKEINELKSKAIQILAKSTFRSLYEGGFSHSEIISLCTNVLGLVADHRRRSMEQDGSGD